MNIMVIKFEYGYRLVRTHRSIELWQNGEKLNMFSSWDHAIAHLDRVAGHAVHGTLTDESGQASIDHMPDNQQQEGPPE